MARLGKRLRLLAAVALALMVASGCTSSGTTPHTAGGSDAGTSTSSTIEQPRPLVGWTGGPLVPPLSADDNALVVLVGAPPPEVTQEQALALAHHVLGGASTFATIQPVSGTVTLSLPPAQVGPGVPEVVDRPSWVIAYRRTLMANCPMMTGPPSTPPNASNLDAVIITGPGLDRQVVVYHGTGTGPCTPSDHPIVSSTTRL